MRGAAPRRVPLGLSQRCLGPMRCAAAPHLPQTAHGRRVMACPTRQPSTCGPGVRQARAAARQRPQLSATHLPPSRRGAAAGRSPLSRSSSPQPRAAPKGGSCVHLLSPGSLSAPQRSATQGFSPARPAAAAGDCAWRGAAAAAPAPSCGCGAGRWIRRRRSMRRSGGPEHAPVVQSRCDSASTAAPATPARWRTVAAS